METKKGSDDKARTDIESNLDWLSNVLIAQSENGLFDLDSVKVRFDEIEDALDKARKEYTKAGDDLTGSKKAVEECWYLVNKAINQAGQGYRNRFINVRDIATIIGVAFVLIIFAMMIEGRGEWFGGIPFWALLLGSLGGCLRSIWWLYQHIDQMDFRRSWWYWFIISPFVGAGLGILTYFAVLAGVTATTASTLTSQNGLTMFLVGFAGFNWTWAMGFLEKLAGSQGPSAISKRP